MGADQESEFAWLIPVGEFNTMALCPQSPGDFVGVFGQQGCAGGFTHIAHALAGPRRRDATTSSAKTRLMVALARMSELPKCKSDATKKTL
jgi:hypothetical protein